MSKELGARLFYLRTHRVGCTQQTIADLLHIERSTYGKYETGVTEPSVATLIKLQRIFKVSYRELLEGELTEAMIADHEMEQQRRRRICHDRENDKE